MHIGCYTTYVLRIAFTHINLVWLGINSYILKFHTSKYYIYHCNNIKISPENVCPDLDETQIIIIELKKYTFLYHR